MLELPITGVTQHFIMQIYTTWIRSFLRSSSLPTSNGICRLPLCYILYIRHTTPIVIFKHMIIIYQTYEYYIRIHTQKTCTPIIKHEKTGDGNTRLVCEFLIMNVFNRAQEEMMVNFIIVISRGTCAGAYDGNQALIIIQYLSF